MDRTYIDFDEGEVTVRLQDYALQKWGIRGRTSSQVTPQQHVNVLTMAQYYVDQSISKTVNFDGRVSSWQDFKDLYTNAWSGGAKALSVFNASGSRYGILQAAESDTPQPVP